MFSRFNQHVQKRPERTIIYNNGLSTPGTMTLSEALKILQGAPKDARGYSVWLIAGSTPEPFSQFLAAHLQRRRPDRVVSVKTGQYGDLAGNLARYFEGEPMPGLLLIEWADLDPRLGVRDGGRWGRQAAADIVGSVRLRLDHLKSLFANHRPGSTLLLSAPTLPLPPVQAAPPGQASQLEVGLDALMAGFVAAAAALPGVRILSRRALNHVPLNERVDLKAWWMAGAPYRRPFASLLAEQAASAIDAPGPLKGIITDLDGTLWDGILGEVGADGVHWDLEHHAAVHGVYQQFLQSLAEDGVLVGIASKNDQELVDRALQRPDLRLAPTSVFPLEAHWQPKPESVARILKAWNIGAESVVFIDDSRLELASVEAAFPGIHCREFPAESPEAFWTLLEDLAASFGKAEHREEDSLRLESLRSGLERNDALAGGYSEEDLLKSSEAELTISGLPQPPDPRALELINKTNQFNLNGARYSEAEWLQYLRSGGLCWMASYRDKFGALGKIAVLAGRRKGSRLEVDTWVMSCRAFSRRVEHATLDFLFQEEDLREVVLHFVPTERNTPIREFLDALVGSEARQGEIRIAREEFAAVRPNLYASICAAR